MTTVVEDKLGHVQKQVQAPPHTVLDRVERWATHVPQAPAVSAWRNGAISKQVSYSELRDIAARAGIGLRALAISPADRVVLSMSNGPAFVGALLACVETGAIAVPAPTPSGSRRRAFEDRLTSIIADCHPGLIVTDVHTIDTVARTVAAGSPALRVVSWDALLTASDEAKGIDHSINDPQEVLLLQYTSGSTGVPRGVVVTHTMAAAQIEQSRQAFAENPKDTAVTWVPLFHDMGLVTGVLRPLYNGYHSVLMEAQEFIAHPRSWLDAISQTRATLSSAPNFAYEYCTRKVRLDPSDQLDLTSWRVARNAGEVVRASTADRFVAAFADAGFRRESFCPSYGMAEATLTIAACSPAVSPLRTAGQPEHGSGVPLISSGVPVAETRIDVRRAGLPLAEGEVGELWVSGPQVFSRYWPHNPAPIEDGWLRTRDIGFVKHGHVFVLGRSDDTVILRGRNFYAQDIHEACSSVEGLRPGRFLALGIPLKSVEEEDIWLVGELNHVADRSKQALARIAAGIREALSNRLGMAVHGIGLLPPGSLPVTTSGKIRSSEVRDKLISGALALVWTETLDDRSGSISLPHGNP